MCVRPPLPFAGRDVFCGNPGNHTFLLCFHADLAAAAPPQSRVADRRFSWVPPGVRSIHMYKWQLYIWIERIPRGRPGEMTVCNPGLWGGAAAARVQKRQAAAWKPRRNIVGHAALAVGAVTTAARPNKIRVLVSAAPALNAIGECLVTLPRR